jgi:molybdate transport system ATP-binding protein
VETLEAQFTLQRESFTLDVQFSVPNTGVTAIFGPSGCGKTTLLRCLSGLERAPRGFLKVGNEVWQHGEFFVPTHKRALGYVFQETLLFSHMNVERNLRFGMKRAGIHNSDVLEKTVRLLGIQHLLKRNPASLSGGERQRVAIARALALCPKILLLDEPLSALDNTLKQEILPYLEQMNKELKIPIVYVSHSRDEVLRLAHNVILMEHGKVVGAGTPEDLLKP